VEGASRFLKRLWRLVYEHLAEGEAPQLDRSALNDQEKALRRRVHDTIAKVSDDMGRRHTFNTAIAAVMELANAVSRFEAATDALRSDTVTLVVQVNGKLRGRIQVPADADRAAVEQAARQEENVRRFVEGREVKKVIVVPGRLVNIVVS